MANLVIGLVGGLLLTYALLIGVLLVLRPSNAKLRDVARLLPDLVRLVHRLARDSSLPRGVRARLWLLIAYLAMPFDLIPDFVPVIGFADDAIIVALVLRSVIRSAGPERVTALWPGTPDGLRATLILAGVGGTKEPKFAGRD